MTVYMYNWSIPCSWRIKDVIYFVNISYGGGGWQWVTCFVHHRTPTVLQLPIQCCSSKCKPNTAAGRCKSDVMPVSNLTLCCNREAHNSKEPTPRHNAKEPTLWLLLPNNHPTDRFLIVNFSYGLHRTILRSSQYGDSECCA